MINPVRHYAWGSRTALARLQGRPRARAPEAELWMGAHPSAPSTLVDVDGREINLLGALEADPSGVLGRRCRERFGARLPFLLKVIAVEQALSVQVHPGAGQVAVATGPAPGHAPQGHSLPPTFVDSYGKPELLVAVEPFDALVGLRDSRRAAELLGLLDVAPLLPVRRALTAAAQGRPGPDRGPTLDALVRLAEWPQRQRAVLSAAVTDAARAVLVDPRTPQDPDTRLALEWTNRLADQYPGDPLVLVPLLLDVVRLEPGRAVFIPPGVPHCYLSGVAVEACAASDNVVRAGLTRKAVDPMTLHRLADSAVLPDLDVGWSPVGPHESAPVVPVEEFRLSRVRVDDGRLASLPAPDDGPQVLLCLSGEVTVWAGSRLVGLGGGESAFVGPGTGECMLGGAGTVYRMTVGSC